MIASVIWLSPAAVTTTSGIVQRRLGISDLLVSECCLGGLTWGGQTSDQDAAQQLSYALDMGVNFIDTAESYPAPLSPANVGATDRAIGKWLRTSRTPRDKIVISSKVCGYNDRYTWLRQNGEGTQLSRAQIIEAVDGSLSRLGTDYIDVLLFHWPERVVGLTGSAQRLVAQSRSRPETPIIEQCEALLSLVNEGKIRHWGLSNENAEGLAAFREAARQVGLVPPVCMQNAYSLLQRRDEIDLLPALLESDVEPKSSYIAYSPLAAGVLTGKYSGSTPADGRSRLRMYREYERSFLSSKAPAAVDAYIEIAKSFGLTPTQLALAHCSSRDFITSTVIGATSMKQLEENIAAIQFTWTQELENAVHAVYLRYPNPWQVQVAGGG